MSARSEGTERGGAPARERNREIGWGVAADEDREGIFLRKVIFVVSVAVIGCLGFWIFVTSALNSPASRALTAKKASAGARPVYTVRLSDFPNSKQGAAKEFASKFEDLLDGEEFWFAPLPGDRFALCVGRSTRQDSAALERLLRKLKDCKIDKDRKPFHSAVIWRYPE
ncbi:MAG: hypothetical protein J7M08_07530 [Planctomycetes bacterium]|nr:hypothetical protein [Planctomycetota bacterium]